MKPLASSTMSNITPSPLFDILVAGMFFTGAFSLALFALFDYIKAVLQDMKESDIEDYLKQRVEQLGGEVRKTRWIGRSKAPDRFVMMSCTYHPTRGTFTYAPWTVWVEVKAPGKKATFPSNAHERAQQREHERMRAFGLRVEVIDSKRDVDQLLGGKP